MILKFQFHMIIYQYCQSVSKINIISTYLSKKQKEKKTIKLHKNKVFMKLTDSIKAGI